MKHILQRFQKCIVEEYETPQPPNPGLGPLRDNATCVAGNTCSRASRQAIFNSLQAQANSGDPTDFEAKLRQAILADCFQCEKHSEAHTKQIHCTMDCNGNTSYGFPNPTTMGIGPCFETCKAGVDASGVLQGKPPETQATGGPTVATNRVAVNGVPDPESCDANPDGYFIAPADLLDWTLTVAPSFELWLTGFQPPLESVLPRPSDYTPLSAAEIQQPLRPPASASGQPFYLGSLDIGANEGRLRTDLRDAAHRASPVESLCKAATSFALGNQSDGNAFADLSVTGRRTFAVFRTRPPQESDILGCLQGNAATQGMAAAVLQQAVATALDRAYRVLGTLRAGGWPVACPERAALSPAYIAVSGEDDQPYRPVNVPSAEFPQYDLNVPVLVRGTGRTISVHTRYIIAHTNPPQGDQLTNCASAGRTIPADRVPVLAPNAEVILYIHGMDSRLEEALDLAHALLPLGAQRGRNYTIISVDLPTSGYADNIDHFSVAPLNADGIATGGFLGFGLGFAPNKYNVPLLDFIEDFIVSFVDKLDDQLQKQLKPRIRAVVGGSLGGNMSMRLGRPRPDAPWITNVVPWSPAAIWPSYADDSVKHAGLAVPWYFAGGDPTIGIESPGARRSFFYGTFDWAPTGSGRPQAEFWWRDGWVDSAGKSCKQAHMQLARINLYETYDHNFRLWHWRLGLEQLLFSQQIPKPGTNEPLYLSNTIRMLLMCGIKDTGANLCQNVQDVAPKMELTPGNALFVQNTGHSIHNERPKFLAAQIVSFIEAQR